jgi:hypothetical protein
VPRAARASKNASGAANDSRTFGASFRILARSFELQTFVVADLCVGERNGQQVVGNLRVGEVLQVSGLVGSNDRTEVELIGDFETDAFAFVHRIAEASNENKLSYGCRERASKAVERK